MAIVIGRDGWQDRLDEEIGRVENLLADLKLLKAGHYPAQSELNGAPLMYRPTLVRRDVPALAGHTVRHPRLGDDYVTTSELVVVSGSGEGWVRTRSRLYRYELWQLKNLN